jgi:hypothetical protein
MLSSNAGHFTPSTDGQGVEPYFALRLLAMVLSVLAILATVVGVLIAVVVTLGALGSAGAAARFAPGGVTAGIAGAGILGALVVLLVTALYALLLWAGAQAIRALLSIEGRAREAAGLQRAMLAELRRIAATNAVASSPPPR